MKTVVFETFWKDPADGWSIAARGYARAMQLAGWDVRLLSPVPVFAEPDPDVEREVGHLARPTSSWDAYIFSCALGGLGRMSHVFEALDRARRPRCFYTMFERCRIEVDLGAALGRLEGIFVPCVENAIRLAEAGCNKAWSMPLPYFDDDPMLTLPPPRREPRVFGWHGRWEPRKAPDNLVRAFMRAFRPTDAELYLKLGPIPWTSSPFAGPEAVIATELGRADVGKKGWTDGNWKNSIHLVRGKIPRGDVIGLHAKADVYASASRGEGIDLPAFAARLSGRRVVTTASGGPEDFLSSDDIVVPTTREIPAPDYEKMWGNGATLRAYELDALVVALEAARARPMPAKPVPMFHVHRASEVAKRLDQWLELSTKA